MVQHPPLFAALPTAVLDMTTDFTPLLMGMVIGLFLCALAIAVLIGVHDSWRLPQPTIPPAAQRQTGATVSDAA